MDTQRDAHLLAPHSTSRVAAGQTDPPREHSSEDALSEASATPVSMDTEPGTPAVQTEDAQDFQSLAGGVSSLVPGGPVPSETPDLVTQEPGTPVRWPAFQPGPGPTCQGSGMSLACHPAALSSSIVPAVGQEVALLGPEAGELLQRRRVAERRSIFAMRGHRGPGDSPFTDHSFDPSVDYRSVEWGLPVPQEEWERRVYVELNLATDLRYEGKGARPECHACRQRGSRDVPLAKCVCCENWACSRHFLVPACLDRSYAMCSAHPGLEVPPHTNFSYLCKHW
eukprot:1703783-Amphidinium_carterae.1